MARPWFNSMRGGCALGIFEDEPVPYEEESYQLAVGDKVIAYTDAAIEWSNPDKEIFGLHRLLDTLTQHRNESIASISTALTGELEKFSRGLGCKDDLTVLTLEFTGD